MSNSTFNPTTLEELKSYQVLSDSSLHSLNDKYHNILVFIPTQYQHTEPFKVFINFLIDTNLITLLRDTARKYRGGSEKIPSLILNTTFPKSELSDKYFVIDLYNTFIEGDLFHNLTIQQLETLCGIIKDMRSLLYPTPTVDVYSFDQHDTFEMNEQRRVFKLGRYLGQSSIIQPSYKNLVELNKTNPPSEKSSTVDWDRFADITSSELAGYMISFAIFKPYEKEQICREFLLTLCDLNVELTKVLHVHSKALVVSFSTGTGYRFIDLQFRTRMYYKIKEVIHKLPDRSYILSFNRTLLSEIDEYS